MMTSRRHTALMGIAGEVLASLADRRHPCGSLRTHTPHPWTGQTSDPPREFDCPGSPPVPRSRVVRDAT